MHLVSACEIQETEVTREGIPGVEAALGAIGGKWKILILWHLGIRTSRYSELRRQIPGVTEKMLIQQLRELERDGIIERRVYPEVPPRVDYAFTEYGASLRPVLCMLRTWGMEHLARQNEDTTTSANEQTRPAATTSFEVSDDPHPG